MLARASVGRARPPGGGAFLATEQSWKQSACDVMGEGSAVAAEADGQAATAGPLAGRVRRQRVRLGGDGRERAVG